MLELPIRRFRRHSRLSPPIRIHAASGQIRRGTRRGTNAPSESRRTVKNLLLDAPVEGADRTGVDAFAAFSAAVGEALVEGGSDAGEESALLGRQESPVDDLLADLHADAAFDAFAAVLNDGRVADVIADRQTLALDRVGLAAVGIAMLAEFAVLLVGAAAFDAALPFVHDLLLRHGRRDLLEGVLAQLEADELLLLARVFGDVVAQENEVLLREILPLAAADVDGLLHRTLPAEQLIRNFERGLAARGDAFDHGCRTGETVAGGIKPVAEAAAVLLDVDVAETVGRDAVRNDGPLPDRRDDGVGFGLEFAARNFNRLAAPGGVGPSSMRRQVMTSRPFRFSTLTGATRKWKFTPSSRAS